MDTTATLARINAIRHAGEVSPQDADYLYECLSKSAHRTVKAAVIQTLRYLQDRYEGAAILLGQRLVEIDIDLAPENSFYMYVLDVFGVKSKGTCVSGFVSDGMVTEGHRLQLEKADGRNIATACIECVCPYAPTIGMGVLVHIFIEDVTMGEVSQGDVLRSA